MVSEQDVNYIMNLSRGERPEKRIREYLNSLPQSCRQKQRRIEFFNKLHKAFFTHYFGKFAGSWARECSMEAYAEALEKLNNGAILEDALQCGLKAGSKLFNGGRT